MDTIKSRSNQIFKYARRVREGKIDSSFFVEGKRLVEELPKSAIEVESVFTTPDFVEGYPEQADRLHTLTSNVYGLSASMFSSLSETKSPQGVAAVCRKPFDGRKRLESNLNKSEKAIAILLHGVNNPGNLGAIIRSAEAFGVSGLIMTNGSTDPFSAKAVRGSMGSVFRLPVWMGLEFSQAIEWAENLGIRTVCADTGASSSLSVIKWDGRSMLVFGSEAHGLSKSERDLIKEEFCVSISDPVESLNLAVAAGIAMYVAANGGGRA